MRSSGSDRGLDGWIAAHLTTAQHLCGTAAMGSADDPLAVVDPALRVHGIERLRVVDLSVLPVAPRRGTAATAVAVGEAGAEFLGARARRDGRMNHMTDGSALLQRFGAADACAARLLCDDHPADDVAFTVVEPDLSARELTYGELGSESARFAAALADLGVGPGDRVAVLMSRSIELIVTLLGIWRRGAVLVPLSTALGRPAIATRLRAADVALVVVDADRRTKLAAGEGVPADPRWQVVVVRGEPGRRELSFEALMALYLDDSLLLPVAAGGDGPLALVFTAGTTGPPKAIAVPVRALAAFAAACLVDGDRPGDVHWDTADPGWATGLYSAILGPLATGRRSLLTRGAIAPAPAWGLLARYRVTHLHAGPAHFRTMAAAGPPPPGLALRHASSTGEPLPPDLVTWAEEVLGHPVHDRYEQAELGTVLVDDAGCGPGTMGRPLPGWSVAVLYDDRDEPAPPVPSAGSRSTGRPAR